MFYDIWYVKICFGFFLNKIWIKCIEGQSKSEIDRSMTVLDRITAQESQKIKKCHWPVNDSFGSYYSPGNTENWEVSLTSQWHLRNVLQPRNHRKLKSVIDKSMTVLDHITAQELQKIEKCHWLVNDSFWLYYSWGIAEK